MFIPTTPEFRQAYRTFLEATLALNKAIDKLFQPYLDDLNADPDLTASLTARETPILSPEAEAHYEQLELRYSESLARLEAIAPEVADLLLRPLCRTKIRKTRKLLLTPVVDLPLSDRVQKAYKAADVTNLAGILEAGEDICKFPNFGKGSYKEVLDYLASKKLEMGMDLTPYKLNEG